jgi:hypothetical protein
VRGRLLTPPNPSPYHHLPRHPPTVAPTLTPTHHCCNHRQHRPYRQSTCNCDSGVPLMARILTTMAPFFQKKNWVSSITISPDTHPPSHQPILRRTTVAITANTDRIDSPPTTVIQALHRRHAFRQLGLHFSKKNLGFFKSKQVSPKFLYRFCCLKCIEGFY